MEQRINDLGRIPVKVSNVWPPQLGAQVCSCKKHPDRYNATQPVCNNNLQSVQVSKHVGVRVATRIVATVADEGSTEVNMLF
jgi:hypothetical protein